MARSERPEIGDRFDDDEQLLVAALVAADRAGIAAIDIAADRTDDDFLTRTLQGVGKRREQLLALADADAGGAARRARPEPRQARQQLDEPLDFRPGDPLRHR